MAESKIQKIVVLLSFTSTDKSKILNGLKIATIFKKELCLFYNYSKKEKKNYAEIKFKVQEYTKPILAQIQDFKISTLLLSEKTSELPEILSDNYEAIFLIAGFSEFSNYSTALSESPIPFLFINENRERVPAYKNLILPLDLRKESSESALWSSYFGRFNRAGIVVVAANDKGKSEQKQVARNVVLTQKLFQKFQIQHKLFKGEKSSFGNVFEALDLAISSKADLIVALASSTITPVDYLVGLPERKIIKKAGDLSVLFINPRKDNYILCD